MLSDEQRLRVLLNRLVALDNRRPILQETLVQAAESEGMLRPVAERALAALQREGVVRIADDGRVFPNAPRLPQDVTEERASRMRLWR